MPTSQRTVRGFIWINRLRVRWATWLSIVNHQYHSRLAFVLLIGFPILAFVYFSTADEALEHLLIGLVAIALVILAHNLYTREATRFNLIADNVQDIICQVDTSAVFRYISKSVFMVTGYPPEMFINKSAGAFMSLLHPDDLPRVEAQWQGTVPSRVEYRLRHAQGHYIWVETICNQFSGADGRPAGIIFSIRDTTRQHEVREALQRSEERLAKVFRGSPLALSVTTRSEGRYLEVNESFCRITGFSAEAALGKTALEIQFWVEAADRSRFMEQLETNGSLSACPFRFRRASGEIRDGLAWAERLELMGEPCTLTTFIDNSEQKRDEEKLRYQANLLDSVSDAILAVDAQFKIVSWNKAAETIYGWRADEIIGQPLGLLPHRDETATRELYAMLIAQESWRGEVKHMHRDGHPLHIAASVKLLRNEAGEPIGAVGINTDITERKRTEEALAESREFLARIAEATPSLLYVYDYIDQRNVYANREIYQILGYTAQEIRDLGSMFIPLKLHPDDLVNVPVMYEQLNKSAPHEIVENEYRMKHANGEWRWFNAREIVFTRTTEGLPQQVVGIAQDVTDRKRAEQALRQSEAYFRAIFESSPDSFMFMDLDKHIQVFNRSARDRLSIPGSPMEQGDSIYKHLRASDVEAFEQHFKDAINGLPVFKEKLFNVPPHGELWLAISYTPVPMADGQIIGVLFSAADITAQKRIEIALRESERRAQAILSAIPDLMFRLRGDGIFVDYWISRPDAVTNPIMLPNLIGSHILAAFSPDLAARILAQAQKTLQTGDTQIAEYQLETSQGLAQREVRMVVSGPNEVLIIVRDIGERIQAQKQTLELAIEREKVRVLADFIRDTSHNLRTPLSVIITSIYLCRRFSDAAKQRQHLDVIENHINYLRRVIEDLLAMSSLDSGVEFAPSSTDINWIVRETVTALEQRIAEKPLKLTVEVQPMAFTLQADINYLSRAVRYLLDNAINYTPPNGTITIRVYEADKRIAVEIQDTGIGISAEALPHIFERFYRVSQSRVGNGTGLGLAMVKKIVELHHGDIQVESTPGVGSTFRMLLPLSI